MLLSSLAVNLANTATHGDRATLREAAATFLIVSLLLLALFVVIAVIMVVRRRRVAMANARSDQRRQAKGDALADPWAAAGERAEPLDSRDVD